MSRTGRPEDVVLEDDILAAAGGVAIGSAVPERAAVDGEAGCIAPGFAVADDAAEVVAVTAGGVVVAFVIEILAIFTELEAHAAVAVGKIVMEQAIDAAGRIV